MAGVTERFAERTRDRLRAEIVDAATAEVLAHGWRGLRMQVIADAVGVSRQTIYNEFVSKQGLAKALALTIAVRYHRETVAIIERSPDARSALRDTVQWTMDTSADDTLLKMLLGADGAETFLPLYTSEGAPVIEMAVDMTGEAFDRRFPELDPDRLTLVLETVTRYVMSHLVLRTRPTEQVAENAAAMFGDYLLGGATPQVRR